MTKGLKALRDLKIRKSFKKGKGKLLKTKEALNAAVSDFRERLVQTPTQVTRFVKKNPYKTVGFTVLAGVLVTQLIRLRHYLQK